jgi:Sigma-70 region 2
MSMSCTTGQLCTATSAARQTPDTPDVALVRSIAAGDKHAMRILFARHNVRVFRFVLRLVGDNSVAEDLVSEVFLDVASGRKISGPIPGYDLASSDCPQQGAFGTAAPVDRRTGRRSGSSHRGPGGQPRGNDPKPAEDRAVAQVSDTVLANVQLTKAAEVLPRPQRLTF